VKKLRSRSGTGCIRGAKLARGGLLWARQRFTTQALTTVDFHGRAQTRERQTHLLRKFRNSPTTSLSRDNDSSRGTSTRRRLESARQKPGTVPKVGVHCPQGFRVHFPGPGRFRCADNLRFPIGASSLGRGRTRQHFRGGKLRRTLLPGRGGTNAAGCGFSGFLIKNGFEGLPFGSNSPGPGARPQWRGLVWRGQPVGVKGGQPQGAAWRVGLEK